MKYSIITPTHSKDNIPNLIELYCSIISQFYINWEWILYLNCGLTVDNLPDYIRLNSNVKIFEQKEENRNIGYIKNQAFNKAIGRILVEADHDDMLAVNCLEELHKVFSKEKEVGFVYSNCLIYADGSKFIPYRDDYGWTHNLYNFKGQDRPSMNHFPPTSHSLSYIWFAPDHVRAWRKETYQELGGHNPELSICDDHELLIRTYLNTKIKHIEKPLYVYRLTSENTWMKKRKEIVAATNKLFDQYAIELAEKDARNLLKVDLGGGLHPYKDYKVLDIRNGVDLNKPFPLETNSVGVLRAHHVLEHLKDPIHSMREIYRVLAPGAWAFIEVPSTDGRGAWQDPTHVSFWNQNSFFYYTRKEQAQYIDNTDIRFQVYKLDTYYPNQFHRDNNILITRAALVAIKDDDIRYPGPLLI